MGRFKLVLVCLLALSLTGCIWGLTKSGSGSANKAYVRIIVEWDNLDASAPIRPASMALQGLGDDVEVIGARVVAPEINAVLAQSATRQTAETQGVITIPVPAVSNASLYAVAVDASESPVMFGRLTGISTSEGAILTITSDDLTWVTPDAYFTGVVKWTTPSTTYNQTVDLTTLESGSLAAPDEVANQDCGVSALCIAEIFVNVVDPFGSTPAQPMICLGGFGTQSSCYQSGSPVQDGWQNASVICLSTSADCVGTPFVNGTYFSLDDRYYFGGEFGPFAIDWRP